MTNCRRSEQWALSELRGLNVAFPQFLLPYQMARRLAIFCSCLLLFFHSVSLGANLGNVMPLGDSITLGVGDPTGGGYRDPLYTQLTNAGHTFQFVGTLSSSPTELLTSTGQQNHEGHSGYVIEAGTSGREGIRDNITTYLGATDPDLILLMIGTNDVSIGYQLDTATERLGDLLTDIATLEPDAHTIVANLVPFRTSRGRADPTDAYNAAVPGVVAAHQGMGHNVSFLDMHSFLGNDDLVDVLHPNATGYDKMATAWSSGIDAILVPEPSAAALSALGWLGLIRWRRRKRSCRHLRSTE